MREFRTQSGRDAWATIRGYVYQVCLTIEHWLTLGSGQVLELECGEDIDIVSRCVTPEGIDEERVLEQVKYRSRRLSLRSEEALAAVARALNHRKENPELPLQFRYITNAQVAKERGVTFPQNLPGIIVWNHIREESLGAEDEEAALHGLRSFLHNASKPAGIGDELWTGLSDVTAPGAGTAFRDFVRSFEWACRGGEPEAVRSRIRRMLLENGHAGSAEVARDQLQRLFFHTFKTLTQSGRKVLDEECLLSQLSLPTLSETDQALLQTLDELVVVLQDRVDEINERLTGAEHAIQRTEEQVRCLARIRGFETPVGYAALEPVLDVPPPVQPLAQRPQLVQELADALADKTWLALSGDVGCGKTQLAWLIADHWGRCAAWGRTSRLDETAAAQYIDDMCAAFVGDRSSSTLSDWYRRWCEDLGRDALVVLDDLPRLVRGSPLIDRLRILCLRCQEAGVRVLSTSGHRLPVELVGGDGERAFLTEGVPRFDESETTELLEAFGAPDGFASEEKVKYLQAITGGHPSLLAAAAHHLKQRGWQLDERVFAELTLGTHTEELNRDTQALLVKTVPDRESRQLLYRLNVNIGPFDFDSVQLLSQVSPQIEAPAERLNDLVNVWLQRDVGSDFRVSPLVRHLGTQNLAPDVARDSHLVLGNRIMHRGTLNQYDTNDAVTHFIAAGDYDRAGTVLVIAFNAIAEHQRTSEYPLPEAPLFLQFWFASPLPAEMDLGLRIYVRSLQIKAAAAFYMDVSDLLARLDALIEQATEEHAWAVVPAALIAGPLRDVSDVRRANRYLLTALRALPQAQLPTGEPLPMPEETDVERLVWGTGSSARTADDLDDWFDTVEQMTEEQRARVFSREAVEDFAIIVGDRLWFVECDKPEEERDWGAVLSELQRFAVRAKSLNELLWACFVRAQIVVLGEYLKEVSKARELAEATLAAAADDPRIRFLVTDILGRQYVFEDAPDVALELLDEALDQETEAFPIVRVESLLHASRAAGMVAGKDPVTYAQGAAQLARTNPNVPDLELVKALGELAIAYWKAGDIDAAFGPWEGAAECLLAGKTDSELWKDIFVVFAHSSGYLASIVRAGEPPQFKPGGDQYAEPYPGVFLSTVPGRTEFYQPENDAILAVQVALFGEATGRKDRAARWFAKAWQLAEAGDSSRVRSTVGFFALPYLIQSERFADAFDIMLNLSPRFAAYNLEPELQQRGDLTNRDIVRILGEPPNEHWERAERHAAFGVLIPTTFHLCKMALGDQLQAGHSADKVARLCRQTAGTATLPDIWASCADLMCEAFSCDSSADSLLAKSQDLDSDEDNIQLVLVYLCVCAQPDCLPRRAVALHLALMPFLHREFSSSTWLYEKVIVAYLSEYWTAVFERARFRFRTPRLVEQGLAEATEKPVTERAQSLLSCVASALDVTPGKAGKEWLSGPTQGDESEEE